MIGSKFALKERIREKEKEKERERDTNKIDRVKNDDRVK